LPLSGSDPDDLRSASFDEEEAANFRRHFLRQALRWALTFGTLFELLTLPEPHRVRVSAPGYRTTMVDVGSEHHHI
jgi:hypothetical protein